VPAQDPAALAAALAALLAGPEDLAALGRAGRARWEERFSLDRLAGATEALYRERIGA
jgi:glycosyltransferase involved in cell wall biosynthesis